MSFPNKAFPGIDGDAATGLDCAAAGGTELCGSADYLLGQQRPFWRRASENIRLNCEDYRTHKESLAGLDRA
jgi:hypothetical protein